MRKPARVYYDDCASPCMEDSSRQWYLTLKETLIQLQCQMSRSDKSMFYYYMDNKLHVMHVNDIIYAGTEKFRRNVIVKLTKKF